MHYANAQMEWQTKDPQGHCSGNTIDLEGQPFRIQHSFAAKIITKQAE